MKVTIKQTPILQSGQGKNKLISIRNISKKRLRSRKNRKIKRIKRNFKSKWMVSTSLSFITAWEEEALVRCIRPASNNTLTNSLPAKLSEGLSLID